MKLQTAGLIEETMPYLWACFSFSNLGQDGIVMSTAHCACATCTLMDVYTVHALIGCSMTTASNASRNARP